MNDKISFDLREKNISKHFLCSNYFHNTVQVTMVIADGNSGLVAVKKSPMKQKITKFTLFTFKLILKLFGLNPFSENLFVQYIYFGCSLFIVLLIFSSVFVYDKWHDDKSIGSLITAVLFVAKFITHWIIVVEAFVTRQKRKQICLMLKEIDFKLKINLNRSLNIDYVRWNLSKCFICITTVHVLCLVIIFISDEPTYPELFSHAFLSSQICKIRILEIICLVFLANERIRIIWKFLDNFDDRHHWIYQTIATTILLPDSRRDALILSSIKSVYSDIHRLFQLINDTYGWSLLAIVITYFISFVRNSYWIFISILTNKNISFYFRNVIFGSFVVIMLAILCWQCQMSSNYGKHIGCSIFKFVKPLGSHHYHIIVKEFSLQLLHQPFIITAKEFFNLNLNLLGSMIITMVTYFVILIQFKFSETVQL